MPKLGVNIDHVATVRQARMTIEPDPVAAAAICELAGADSIVCHLRQDRRHINDRDLEILKKTVQTRLNLEMAAAGEIIRIAQRVRPDQATLVPEKRQEVTTEGGLNVAKAAKAVGKAIEALQSKGIEVSLFIDPAVSQIKASGKAGAKIIELHTGAYANSRNRREAKQHIDNLRRCVEFASQAGLEVNAGHGLTYRNVKEAALIPGINELNIGHSVISRAVLVGLDKAVREMLALIK